MKITKELGNEIIKRLSKYTEVHINIMNLNGKIVASTDEKRLDQVHSGARKVIESQCEVILFPEDVVDYPGSKPGVNLPILHRGMIKGVVGVSGNPDLIQNIAGMVRATTELVLEQIYIQKQMYFKERQWAYWVQQLLHPIGTDIEQLESDAIYSLKIDIKNSWRVIVLEGSNIQDYYETLKNELLKTKINCLFVLPFMKDEIIMAISHEFSRLNELCIHMIKHFEDEIRIGVGNVEYSIKGLRNSYFQAKQALSFSNKKQTITNIDNWKVERLIKAIDDSEYISVCKNYQTLLELMGEEYIKTLYTYLNTNCSIKETAELLHIHRNTLLYRLEQLKDRVGLDPKCFKDAFIYKIILNRIQIV